MLANYHTWSGQLSCSPRFLDLTARYAAERGDVYGRIQFLLSSVEFEWRVGRWDRARAQADEPYELFWEAQGSQVALALYLRSLVAASQGRVDEARADTDLGVRTSVEQQDQASEALNRFVRG